MFRRRHSPRGATVVVTRRTVAVVSVRGARRRMVRGPLRGKRGWTRSGRAF